MIVLITKRLLVQPIKPRSWLYVDTSEASLENLTELLQEQPTPLQHRPVGY